MNVRCTWVHVQIYLYAHLQAQVHLVMVTDRVDPARVSSHQTREGERAREVEIGRRTETERRS